MGDQTTRPSFLTLRRAGRGVLSFLTKLRAKLWKSRTLYAAFWSAIAGFPPFFVSGYLGSDKVAAAVTNVDPAIAEALNKHVLVFLILAAAWLWALTIFKDWLTAMMNPTPVAWVEAPAYILKSLDQILGHKAKHHNERLNRYFSGKQDSTQALSIEEVLDGITRPRQQIDRIVEQIFLIAQRLFCSDQGNGQNIKVNLAFIEDGVLKQFMCHFPAHLHVKSSIEELNDPKSGIQSARRERRIIVHSSIRDESERENPTFVQTSATEAGSDGSLICIPIPTVDPKISFVLSIFCPVRGAFDPGMKQKYHSALEPFVLRIQFEYSLLCLQGFLNNAQ